MTDTTITQGFIEMMKAYEAKPELEAKITSLEARIAELTAKLAEAQEVKAGKISKGRGGNKVSAVVMTEARRLAKEVVKNEIRVAGMKISHVEASQITKAANELMTSEQGADFIAQAVELIEQRKAVKSNLDIASLVHVSPELVAKAEKAKAERKKRG